MTCSRTGVLALLAWCLTIAWCATNSAAPQDEPAGDIKPRVLYLHTEFLPYKQFNEGKFSYRLGREMIRQALLIAARDEMGLVTVDETLHETPPDDDDLVHLMLIERSGSDGIWGLKLIAYEEGQDIHEASPIWTKSFKSAVGGVRVYGYLTPRLEEDSRGEFVEALRKAGLRGEKASGPKPAPPSEAIEESLNQVDFIAQYGAVRAAHQTIATHGETPEWLGVLARGYANMAMLTQHQWNSSSEVYTARAWLYAQRMFASKKARDSALWHRAYAWALGGTLQHVLEDLERIERRRAENTTPESFTPPTWTQLIEPYAMCDRAATRQVGQEIPALQGWASRLTFQLASAYRQPQWMWDAAYEMARVCPTVYGVYAELAAYGETLRATRTGAMAGPRMLGLHSVASLSAVPGMPEKCKTALSALKNGNSLDAFHDPDPNDLFSAVPPYMARCLREESKQTSDCDPSWSALAFFLEEELFVQAINHLKVARNATERSLAEDIDAILPLLKGHRYAVYLDSYRLHKRRDWDAMQKLLTNIVIEDPRQVARRLVMGVVADELIVGVPDPPEAIEHA